VLLYLGKVLVIQTLEERHLAQLFAGSLCVHEGACKVQALLLPVNQMNYLLYFCFIHQTCMKHEAYTQGNLGRVWHRISFRALLAVHDCDQLDCFALTVKSWMHVTFQEHEQLCISIVST